MAKATAKVEKGIVQIRFPVDETKAYPDATFQTLTQAAYAYRKLVLLMVSRVGRKPNGNGLDPHILEIIDDMIDGWAHECEFGGLRNSLAKKIVQAFNLLKQTTKEPASVWSMLLGFIVFLRMRWPKSIARPKNYCSSTLRISKPVT